MTSFTEFKVGDLVFSDGNNFRVWTVVETARVGVKLKCSHFRDGNKVGAKLDSHNIVEPDWFTGNPRILHVVSRSARVV